MPKNIFFTKRINKYQGKYVAVADNKVLASGNNAVAAWKSAEKIRGRKKVSGVYYIPSKQDVLTALCALPTKNLRQVSTLPS